MTEKQNKLIEWAREIQALAQTGLTYAPNHYEVDRNRRLLEIAAEILSEATDIKFERAAVVRDGKILLVKEISDGKWSMPGGWADVGDMPAEAAEREAKEESGFDVKAVKIVGVFDANRNGRPLIFYHAVKLVYLCEIITI